MISKLKDYIKNLDYSEDNNDQIIDLLQNVYETCDTNLKNILQKNILTVNKVFNLNNLKFTIALLDFENNQFMKYNYYDSELSLQENMDLEIIDLENIDENSIYSELIFSNEKKEYQEKGLILVPMTLRNNEDLTKEFKESFFSNGSASHIWGFISFQSSQDFKQEDLNLAHIITDIISLYFIFFHDHTEGSKSFNDALELLS